MSQMPQYHQIVRRGFASLFKTVNGAALLGLLLACGGGGEQDVVGPPPPAALPDVAGTWTISSTWNRASARCDYSGLLIFSTAPSAAQGDLRHTGTCVSQTRDPQADRVPVTLTRTTAGDSLAISFSRGSASCRYAAPISGNAPASLTGVFSCSDGWLGNWAATRGAPASPQLPSLQSISAGNFSTCAVAVDGRAFCWGANAYGELGTGDAIPRLVATAALDNYRWAQISVSPAGVFACGLTTAGAAYCWGNATGPRLGNGTSGLPNSTAFTPVLVAGGHTFTRIATGGDHVCAIRADQVAHCWGYNGAGQLGSNTAASAVPVPVTGDHRFTEISAHILTSCGVTTTGATYCWGSGSSGQLGNGGTASSSSPVAVAGGLAFRVVAVGFLFACGVTTTGEGYCWGFNGAGELGSGSTQPVHTTPVKVADAIEWAEISGGVHVTCGISAAGRGYCWGGNLSGERGDGTVSSGVRNTPTPVSTSVLLADISADWHVCGISREGAAYCWGPGPYGSLGDGTLQDRSVPTRIASQP